ncbi:MAG: hypothetical protein GF309_10105 [Candidatus Lokiarchaeota archaeon]|nr:hypothetical protein [Candidatus Lokiarchaeota archaeon]
MIENTLLELMEKGLSWRDYLAASNQAELLDLAKRKAWRKQILDSAEQIGITNTLKQIALSFQLTQAWGMYLNSILRLFEIREFYGLACDPSQFVEKIAQQQPESWGEVNSASRELALKYLKEQIETGDVFLLRPSQFEDPDLMAYLPKILDARKAKMGEARPYLMQDGLVDMFDFLELPLALNLLVKSGVGGRTTIEEAKPVLEKLVELKLSPVKIPEAARDEVGSLSVKERYLGLYTDSISYHKDLLQGITMSLDIDDQICRIGLEKTCKIGHEYCKEPFLFALGREDESTVACALTGLGRLGIEEVIPQIRNSLRRSSPVIQKAACDALGVLRASECTDELRKLVDSSDDKVRLSALKALFRINSPTIQNEYWKWIREFDIVNLASMAKEIGATKSDYAVSFLVNLLMLDLQAFLETDEIRMFNMIMALRRENQEELADTLIDRLRTQAVAGFKRLGSIGVPVLASLLKLYPETAKIIETEIDWKPSEEHILDLIQRRIQAFRRISDIDYPKFAVTEAIEALGLTHSERAIPYLVDLVRSEREEIVHAAMEALGEIDLPALEALLEVPETHRFVTLQKIERIGSINHRRASKYLIQKTGDSDPLVRAAVAKHLVLRMDSELSKPLAQLARDPDENVRRTLAIVLLRLGVDCYPGVVEILRNDTDESVQQIIVESKLFHETRERDEFWA